LKSKIFVIGLGKSGIGAARLSKNNGDNVTIIEEAKSNKYKILKESLLHEGIYVELGQELNERTFEPWITQGRIKSIIISPGIPWDHPTLTKLRKSGIDIQGEINMAWQAIKEIPWIGITGTNGKTTVTYLLNHILESNSYVAPMGGNMGIPASQLALALRKKEGERPDIFIMEISSYQIESSPEINPFIGIWTNFTPDHLERHKTIEKYKSIKKSLIERSGVQILNADDPEILNIRESFNNPIWVSSKDSSHKNNIAKYWINNKGFLIEGSEELFETSILRIPGEHNIQNLLLATAAARYLGISAKGIKKSLRNFDGVPHRLEEIGEVNDIRIINDSKATNFEAATSGLKAIKGTTILLAGGQLKHGNPSSWIREVNQKVYAVILFGAGAKELKIMLKQSDFPGELICYENLEEATNSALQIAKIHKIKSIILSPACSSFDQYENFEDRGDHFKKLIFNISSEGIMPNSEIDSK